MRSLQIGNEWLMEKEGGLERYYFELLRHLPASRASAVGLVVGSSSVEVSSRGQVRSFAKSSDSMWKRMTGLRNAALPLIRRGQVDLVVCHFAPYGLPLLDRFCSVPLVVHFHGPWSAESRLEGAWGLNERAKAVIEQLVFGRARWLIVLSEAFRRELVCRYQIPEAHVRVIPGGVDIKRFNITVTRVDARQQLGWPQDRPILLAVRRQVRRMGLEQLIDAVQMLLPRHPELLLLLGGSGPIAGELQQRVVERGLSRNVRLLGRISDADLPAAYRAADISVVPTQALEGFGLITLESLAAGTPVFVTPVGGLREIIEPFAPECLFPDTSASGMAQVLSEGLGGKRRLPSEAECRAYSAGNFSWASIGDKVADVYKDALR